MPKKRNEKAPRGTKTRKSGTKTREIGAKHRAAGTENAEIMYHQRLLRKAKELGVTTAELERFIETGERPERIERTK